MNKLIQSTTERTLRFHWINLKNGKLNLWGVPGIMTPLSINSYLWELLKRRYGEKERASFLYLIGKEQGLHATNLFIKKFGFNKSPNKKKLLDLIISQSEITGHGVFKWVRKDLQNNLIIGKGVSNMAKSYRELFGLSSCPIDHFLRGVVTSIVSTILKRKMFCIEKECISMGKKECVFVVKPLEEFSSKDQLFISQFPKESDFIDKITYRKNNFFNKI